MNSTDTTNRGLSPDEHSDVVGGSSAARILNCPGSYQLKKLLPPDESTNAAAERGTALHEAIAFHLDKEAAFLDDLIGMTFNGIVITRDMFNEALVPAMRAFDHFAALCEHEGGFEFDIETRLAFKDIPGAFGTGDIIGRTARRSVVWDWKFGYAPVEARDNAQGKFYAYAGLCTMPDLFEDDPDWPVEIIICQPEVHRDWDTGYDRWSTTVGELRVFRDQLVRAVTEAQSDNPTRKRGSWCAFQNCRAVCDLHTRPLAKLAALADVPVNDDQITALLDVGTTDFDLAQRYADALDLIELVEPVFGEIRKQAHAYMEAGGTVHGRKLVPKRANRSWVDEGKADRMLGRMGLSKADRTVTKLLSPAQSEAALKAAGVKLSEKQKEAFKAACPAVSSGTTVAAWDDPRPEVTNPADRIAELGSKLSKLSE